MIPRTFHRVWLDEPIPAKFEAFWDRFKELHPDWKFRTWDSSEELRSWIANVEAFDWQTTWAGKSDIARYEILARHGGIYVDTDVEPLKSFEPLRMFDCPFIGWEDDRLLCPTVMGSPTEHPAMMDLLRSLGPYASRRKKRPPNQQTGPHFITRAWAKRDDVLTLAPVRFYPVHWSDRASLGGPYPEESYAVHHWNQGWDPEAKARVDARSGR